MLRLLGRRRLLRLSLCRLLRRLRGLLRLRPTRERMPRVLGRWLLLTPLLRMTFAVLPPDVAHLLILHMLALRRGAGHRVGGLTLIIIVKQPEGLTTVDIIFLYICDF